jgi:anti-anti-sigma factor
MLLLTQPPTDVPGLQIAALTIPSQRIDGDFYDFFKHENQRLDVMVADVMGKGIPAALVAAATKSNFLEALCHLTALSRSGQLPEPKEIVTLAHADMVRQLIDLESFVTLSYARFDLGRRQLDLVDCGHTGMMVLRAATGACEILHGNNLPLGIREGEIFDQITVPFESGDLFLFYSDGITDMRSPVGELYGPDRLLECVQNHRELEPKALVDAIRTATVAFAHSDRLTDDLTCVAVRIGDVQPPLARSALEIRSTLEDLRCARTFVRDFCAMVPQGLLDPNDVSDLELAVNEATSNIMKHAYRGRADQRIQLEAETFPDRVSIRLHHLGDSFDPVAVAPRTRRLAGIRLWCLPDHQERGRGEVLSRWSRAKLHYARQVPQAADGKAVTMEFALQQIDDVAVATVPVEDLDAGNVTEFKRDMAPVLDSSLKLVLDLSRLRFVDSSGLGAFISCLRKLNARGGDLKLCGMSKQVRGVFELVRMHRIFDICATSEEAVRAFRLSPS